MLFISELAKSELAFIPDHSYKVLIIGGSVLEKTIVLLNLK